MKHNHRPYKEMNLLVGADACMLSIRRATHPVTLITVGLHSCAAQYYIAAFLRVAQRAAACLLPSAARVAAEHGASMIAATFIQSVVNGLVSTYIAFRRSTAINVTTLYLWPTGSLAESMSATHI